MKIKVKYLEEGLKEIVQIDKGNWIDLRCAKTINIQRYEESLENLNKIDQLENTLKHERAKFKLLMETAIKDKGKIEEAEARTLDMHNGRIKTIENELQNLQVGTTLIPLGIAVELPAGYEAHIVPRSSTFKNFGIIQVNNPGIIDSTYCGDNDEWFFACIAMRNTIVTKNDRICQFKIVESQSKIEIETVKSLGNKNRGGHGSTGIE